MITLYHAPFSVSSQKVRLVLAEKQLAWDERIVDLLAGEHLEKEFKQLNPKAEVPVLIDKMHTLVDSSLINEYLDERFPEVALLPQDPLERYQVRHWSKLIETGLHTSAGIITYAVLARPLILQKPPEIIESLLQSLPDPATRLWRRCVLDNGLDSPKVQEAINRYRKFFQLLESHLTNAHAWLTGDQFSLADIEVLPYVMRAEHVGLGDLMSFEECPNTRSWYLRMMARPSMQPAFVKYVDADTQNLLMQLVVAAQPKISELIQNRIIQ